MAPPQESRFYTHTYRETSSNIFSSEITGPIGAKVHMDPQWIRGMKVYLPHLVHMNKMAAMPIYGKDPLKIFFSRTIGLMALGLGMQLRGHGSNKV